MNDFESSVTTAKQHISSILAEQREKEHETTLEAATDIAARSQATSEAAKGKEPINRKERSWFCTLAGLGATTKNSKQQFVPHILLLADQFE
jgi:hypothetical protein